MESERMVVSEYDGSDGGFSRRRYSITELGEAYLGFWADSLARHQEEIELFLRTYSKSDGRGAPA
jgi:DNA-binding PadR family transcriptional regulator